LWTLNIHHEHQILSMIGAYNQLVPELVLHCAIFV
jgi:hypothetical protein